MFLLFSVLPFGVVLCLCLFLALSCLRWLWRYRCKYRCTRIDQQSTETEDTDSDGELLVEGQTTPRETNQGFVNQLQSILNRRNQTHTKIS